MKTYVVAFDGALCYQAEPRGIGGDIIEEVADWVVKSVAGGNKVYVLTWRPVGVAINHVETLGFPVGRLMETRRFDIVNELPIGCPVFYVMPNAFNYEKGKLPVLGG